MLDKKIDKLNKIIEIIKDNDEFIDKTLSYCDYLIKSRENKEKYKDRKGTVIPRLR